MPPLKIYESNHLAKLTKASHQACSSTSCEIGCLSKVDTNLKTYLDLLYEVMFDKNSKNCREWWLSVFYSLCIQSYVRKSVIILVSHLGQDRRRQQPRQTSIFSWW